MKTSERDVERALDRIDRSFQDLRKALTGNKKTTESAKDKEIHKLREAG